VVERLLTLAEVADLLRLSEATLYRQRYVGDPPGSLGFRVQGFVRFLPSDLERYIDEQRTHSSRTEEPTRGV
jgi:predicted DNA-binding transcriptional regulator AlpA